MTEEKRGISLEIQKVTIGGGYATKEGIKGWLPGAGMGGMIAALRFQKNGYINTSSLAKFIIAGGFVGMMLGLIHGIFKLTNISKEIKNKEAALAAPENLRNIAELTDTPGHVKRLYEKQKELKYNVR